MIYAMLVDGASKIALNSDSLPKMTSGLDDIKTDVLGNKMPGVEVINGTAFIDIRGAIMNFGKLGEFLGYCDLKRVNDNLNDAVKNDQVKSIVLNIDSPGGEVRGLQTTVDLIESCKKPVIAYVSRLAASAAYKIAAASNQILAAPGAEIGSIGTYAVGVDYSEHYKEQGIDVIVWRSGKMKGAGIDGFTEEQRAMIQESIDKNGEEFRSYVESRRSGLSRELMEGQTFYAKEALDIGMIDGIACNFQTLTSNINSEGKIMMTLEEQQAMVEEVASLKAANSKFEDLVNQINSELEALKSAEADSKKSAEELKSANEELSKKLEVATKEAGEVESKVALRLAELGVSEPLQNTNNKEEKEGLTLAELWAK